jgi:cysteinyl-tRNA synthetase
MIGEARAALTRLYRALDEVPVETAQVDWTEPHAQRFAAAMNEDFNTALAVSVLFDLAAEVNRTRSLEHARQLKALGGVLGLLQRAPQEFLRGRPRLTVGAVEGQDSFAGGIQVNAAEDNINSLIEERSAAKRAKDFAKADAIRKQLLAGGIVLEDKPGGVTVWRRQ